MIRIGVIGSSNIAERRMIPAILKESTFQYVGVAISTKDEMGFAGSDEEFAPVYQHKLDRVAHFQELFGGKVYKDYESLINDENVDALYIALPPALHYKWGKKAISKGKHIILEKPFTTKKETTEDLLREAKKNNIAVIENYGFIYHNQMSVIKQAIADGLIGDLRLLRAIFCFPHRDISDFRYDKELGGGALLDCGGYTIKAATDILGQKLVVSSSKSVVTEGHEVDIFGAATLMNENGVCAQLSYGMDNYYQCELEILGSIGYIKAPRIFTAPDGFEAKIIIKHGQDIEEKTASDDQFHKIIMKFKESINSILTREKIMKEILVQSDLIDKVRN